MTSTEDQSLRILVVDDDPAMRHMLLQFFADKQIPATAASSRQDAIRVFATYEPNLIILDLRLGQEDGLDLLREIRAQSDVPLIISTAHGKHEVDRVVGLELGADDYVVKPFGLHELLARAKAVMRRQQLGGLAKQRDREMGIYGFGGWRLDRSNRRLVNPDREQVSLTKNEYGLLVAFLDDPGRPLTREYLMQATRIHEDVFDRSIDVQVLRLRRKLETDPSAPRVIQTERGIGYRFALPVEVLRSM
jgi:two-component system OmpR family response regulator